MLIDIFGIEPFTAAVAVMDKAANASHLAVFDHPDQLPSSNIEVAT